MWKRLTPPSIRPSTHPHRSSMRVLWLSAFVVAVDQATKAAVLEFMSPQNGVPQSIPVLGDWLRLTFTENPGMAFGLTVGPPGTVTVLSILATCLVAGYIHQVRRGYAPYVWSLGLILGGALGNIVDRVFYGVLLDYGTYFTGRVVDFIHVSLWKGFIPEGVPLIGGSYMELFPIWNVADMSIVIGVVGVLLFHRPFHEHHYEPPASQEGAVSAESNATRSDGSASSQMEGASSQSVSVPDGVEADNDEASSAEDPVPQSSENWPKDVD